jgi:hypothetical protein
MRPVVTIFADEFNGKTALERKLGALCDVNLIVGGCFYSPKPDKFAQFLHLLHTNNIRYYPGIYFSPPSAEVKNEGNS